MGLAKELNVYSKTIAEALEEVSSVYTDLKKEVIAGSSYYYVDGVLSGEEAEREKEFAKARKSGISSYKFALGRAHEEFCQFTIDEMMEHGDFKVGEDVSVTIDGDRLVIEKREKSLSSAGKSKP